MMVDQKAFAEAVSKMRKVQKAYFARRSNSLLDEAKKLEGQVDAYLREMAQTNVAIRADQGQQTNLFG